MGSHPNRVLAVVIGGIAVVAVVAAIFSATRPVTSYSRATPEGTVQAYLSALVDGDHEAAAELLAEGSNCSAEDLDRAHVPDGVRVVLRGTKVNADTARVEVDVVMSSGGPFDSSEYAERHTFQLDRAGDEWFITDEPWPMFACAKEG